MAGQRPGCDLCSAALDRWFAGQDSGADFDGQIQLRQVARSAEGIGAGDMLLLRLDWQALIQPKADYRLFVQLLDPDGKVQVQRDLPLADLGLRHSRSVPSSQRLASWPGCHFPGGAGHPGRHTSRILSPHHRSL